MFKYASGNDLIQTLESDFKRYMNECGIRTTKIIDTDPHFRIVSFSMNKQRLGRMYMRYGVILTYKYNDDFTNLLDFKVHRLVDKGRLLQVRGYENYFRSLLLIVIPEVFERYKSTYKVKLLNSFPPYEDEAYETIKQEVVFDKGFSEQVLVPDIGMLVLEISGKQYITKVWSRSPMRYLSTTREDFCKMPTFTKVQPCDRLQCMSMDDYRQKRYKWYSLENVLGVLRRECKPYDPKVYVKGDLNHYSKCEDILDEDEYEYIDGELVKIT